MSLKKINFQRKTALIRVDFNVPLNQAFEITDDTRIKAALPTINYVLDNEGSVVLMSHLGRPKGKKSQKLSLEHIAQHISTLLNREIKFIDDCIGKEVTKEVTRMKPGEVILLENLRFYQEETKGEEAFAKELSKNGDIYINDAFGTAHRAHASTSVIAQFFKQKAFGLLLQAEIDHLQKVVASPKKPVCAIIGGAKVSSKINILENLLEKVDHILIGGGMAFTFIKAIGGKTGDSLVEKDMVHLAKKILEKSKRLGVRIHLPNDVVVADAFSDQANTKVVDARAIEKGWMGLDIAEVSIKKYSDVIMQCQTILWNGPMGVFELEPFAKGTIEIAKAITKSTENGSYSLIGGGDSVAAIKKFNLQEKVSYVSTGGGAMLEYLEGKDLPGIQAIQTED